MNILPQFIVYNFNSANPPIRLKNTLFHSLFVDLFCIVETIIVSHRSAPGLKSGRKKTVLSFYRFY